MPFARCTSTWQLPVSFGKTKYFVQTPASSLSTQGGVTPWHATSDTTTSTIGSLVATTSKPCSAHTRSAQERSIETATVETAKSIPHPTPWRMRDW